MRKGWKWCLKGLPVLGVLVLAGVTWRWDDIQRLIAVNSLFTEDRIVENFSGMNRILYHTEFPKVRGPVSSLPENTQTLPDVSEWAKSRALTAIVVLKGGEIAYEDYYLDTASDDRRISWSVSKSYLSALIGILMEEGAIESINDPVTQYAPALEDTAYDGVAIRDVLQMSSGVRFDENYQDFNSDINRMGRVLAMGHSLNRFVRDISERERDPGEVWQYVSVDTHVLGMVVKGATGRDVIELMADKLIEPMGLEVTPYYVTDGHGTAFVLGGLNMTTRDYARFGQMFLQDGYWNGQQIVPEDWVSNSTAPHSPTPKGETRYGYQWWVPSDAREGEFLARGIYGQYVYVNQPAEVVVAINSVDRDFQEPGTFDQNLAMFRQIAADLN